MKWTKGILSLLTLACGCTAEENANLEQYGLLWLDVSVESAQGIEPTLPFALDLSTADGTFTAHWDNIADYPTFEPLYVDAYVARAVSGVTGSEGYDCPCFVGETKFLIMEGERKHVTIPCGLQQAIVLTNVEDRSASYALDGVMVHTTGHGYNEVEVARGDAPLYVQPGQTTVCVRISDDHGHVALLAPDFYVRTLSDTPCPLHVTLDAEDRLQIVSGLSTTTLNVTEQLLDGEQPVITPSGFTPGVPLTLTEGFPAEQPVVLDVEAPAGLRNISLTVQGSLSGSGLASQYSLLTDDVNNQYIEVTQPEPGHATINFTRMLENLSVLTNSDLTFTVVAEDELGRMSEPCSLRVVITSVEFECVSQSQALLGENVAEVTLHVNTDKFERDDFTAYIFDRTIGEYQQFAILESDIDSNAHTIKLKFDIGEGIDAERVRIDFMGVPKLYVSIERGVPSYAISADAYATHARIYIDAATEAQQRALTRYARVYIDGVEYTVTARDLEAGSLAIGGLRSSKSYKVTTQVIAGEFEAATTFTTEREAQIPDGDLEDANPSFAYQQLPSGGVYSNTPFPLYSQQNHVDIDVWWPQRYWANVNAKTFNRSASNPNTWYMQPSSVSDYDVYASGHKSVRIASVGWSLNGPEIAPYSQREGEQLPYNANVPPCEHRSAGRLFLGTYRFDPATMSETYDEGIKFTSRPRSLNGFYRFKPDAYDSNDRGIVLLELTGHLNGFEVVIATATMQFAPMSGWMAFNLPLDYHYEGVKAERLKLMFASSTHLGDISTEDAEVAVTPDLPTATFVGNQLWIDNLSFSY